MRVCVCVDVGVGSSEVFGVLNWKYSGFVGGDI